MKRGCSQFHASRPTAYGLEMHLVTMHKVGQRVPARPGRRRSDHQPDQRGHAPETQAMLIAADRLPEDARHHGLLHQPDRAAGTTWSRARWASPRSSTPGCCWRSSGADGERNRGRHVLKSRGMAHSNQIREFLPGGARASSCRDTYSAERRPHRLGAAGQGGRGRGGRAGPRRRRSRARRRSGSAGADRSRRRSPRSARSSSAEQPSSSAPSTRRRDAGTAWAGEGRMAKSRQAFAGDGGRRGRALLGRRER